MKKGLIGLIFGNGLSKIIGLLREVLIAYWFGTSFVADAYRVALSIILLPTQLLMGEAFQSTFIPKYKKNMSLGTHNKLFSIIFFTFFIISLVLFIILFEYSDIFVQMISPGFSDMSKHFTELLVKVMALSIPFYIFSYLLVYVLSAYGSFFFSSLTPVTQNIFLIIFSAIAFFTSEPLFMGLGFVVPFIFIFVLIIVYSANKKYLTKQSFMIDRQSFRILINFGQSMIPLLIYMITLQTNIIIERIISSKLGEGVVASIDYARFLYETPLYLIAIPIGTVGLTYFSGVKWESGKKRIEEVTIIALMVFIPFSALLVTNSELFVEILYARGEFTQDSVFKTSQALVGFSLGLWATGLTIIFKKIYSAFFRNKEILIISGFSILINIILNIFMSKYLGIIGISLAFSLSMLIQMILFLWRLKIDFKKITLNILLLILFSCGYYLLFLKLDIENKVLFLILILICFTIYWLVVFLILKATRSYIFKLFFRIKSAVLEINRSK